MYPENTYYWNEDEQKPCAGEIAFEARAENAREAWAFAGRTPDPKDCEGFAFMVRTEYGVVDIYPVGDYHVRADSHANSNPENAPLIDTTDQYLTQFFGELEELARAARAAKEGR